MTIAAACMIVQLVLVGYALRLIFALASPTLLTVALITLVVARKAAVRPEQRLAWAGNCAISLATAATTTALTAILALITAIRPQPW